MNCLINILQQYPLGLHFYKMDEKTFGIEPHLMDDVMEIEKEKLPMSKVPTREQFMAETFWTVYFDSFNDPDGHPKYPTYGPLKIPHLASLILQ